MCVESPLSLRVTLLLNLDFRCPWRSCLEGGREGGKERERGRDGGIYRSGCGVLLFTTAVIQTQMFIREQSWSHAHSQCRHSSMTRCVFFTNYTERLICTGEHGHKAATLPRAAIIKKSPMIQHCQLTFLSTSIPLYFAVPENVRKGSV